VASFSNVVGDDDVTLVAVSGDDVVTLVAVSGTFGGIGVSRVGALHVTKINKY